MKDLFQKNDCVHFSIGTQYYLACLRLTMVLINSID